jgi:hypothetical protein
MRFRKTLTFFILATASVFEIDPAMHKWPIQGESSAEESYEHHAY